MVEKDAARAELAAALQRQHVANCRQQTVALDTSRALAKAAAAKVPQAEI